MPIRTSKLLFLVKIGLLWPPLPPKKIVSYWRMCPSFFSRKIDLFKKKVCPNRTIGSKVTSFWNFQLKDFYPVKLTKCTRTFHSWSKNVKTCNFWPDGPGSKIYISFILIYVIALSFFFPKWGHTLLNYRYFWFYVHLREGDIVKCRGKRTV